MATLLIVEANTRKAEAEARIQAAKDYRKK